MDLAMVATSCFTFYSNRANMKEWDIDIKKDREVFVDGQKLNTYGIQLEKEIKILSKKGPKHNKKINRLKKLLRTYKGI